MTKHHKAEPDREWEPIICLGCHEEIRRVYDRTKPAARRVYWRHVRKR